MPDRPSSPDFPTAGGHESEHAADRAADGAADRATARAIDRRIFVARAVVMGAALSVPTACTTEARGPESGRTGGSGMAAAGSAADETLIAPGVPTEDALFELTVAEAQERMKGGSLSARALTERYLARIDAMDKRGPAVNAVIELNPDALAIADALDAERAAGTVRGPLHGIPVLIKDNIDTADRMRKTAGSLALASHTPAQDAFIVERLRAAGAVLLGKTNLSEWANFRSTRSSSGWSGRGGQTRNPYALDRNPCGSSSGTGAAIASDFATIGIGTETDGSILCPSSINGLVGVKPTVGLWGRSGIIPISASQDTAGPMARTVADAAMLLTALVGEDPRDPITGTRPASAAIDYAAGLTDAGLQGARVGVVRNLAGFHPDVDATFNTAIAALSAAGAEIVDPVEMAGVGGFDDAEFEVLLYEFKDGLDRYLASLGDGAPVHSLAELIAWNEREAAREMPWFGQEILAMAEKKGPLTDRAYLDARARCVRMARGEGIDAALAAHALDVLVYPTNAPAWPTDHLNGDHFTGGNTTFAAVAGYPTVTVPMGLVHGLPVGLTFTGTAWSEAALLRYAHAFEQRTKARAAPRYLRTLMS
jgi:amidase